MEVPVMKRAFVVVLLATIAVAAVGGSAWVMAADETAVSALPEGMKGFKGILFGKIVKKGERGFVLQVDKVGQVWPQSTAKDPQSAVGKTLEIHLWAKSRLFAQHVKTLAALNVGDRIAAEAFNLEGDGLWVVEDFKKADEAAAGQEQTEAQMKQEIARLRERVAQLEKQVTALQEENARLKKQAESK